MVALASLVVESHDALPSDDVRKPVLETMGTRRRRLRQVPDHHLGEGVFREHDPSFAEQEGLHASRLAYTTGVVN